ncbi:VOC family protein [Microbacterium sp.]|uniref:VOC family protein n=1 Tax=Microbacterium sp. TaxID=51671 RepID=UPI002811DDF9|nr:VOC family protein [Microbacterium sp.]
MAAPTLYAWFPGNAREALTFYRDVFGGDLDLHTFEEFGRSDGPADAIAHGTLSGPVRLYGTDAVGDQPSVSLTGVSIALLGTADGATLTRWFEGLSEGADILDPLQKRPWGATDGQLVDRHGIRWLIGFED